MNGSIPFCPKPKSDIGWGQGGVRMQVAYIRRCGWACSSVLFTTSSSLLLVYSSFSSVFLSFGLFDCCTPLGYFALSSHLITQTLNFCFNQSLFDQVNPGIFFPSSLSVHQIYLSFFPLSTQTAQSSYPDIFLFFVPPPLPCIHNLQCCQSARSLPSLANCQTLGPASDTDV